MEEQKNPSKTGKGEGAQLKSLSCSDGSDSFEGSGNWPYHGSQVLHNAQFMRVWLGYGRVIIYPDG